MKNVSMLSFTIIRARLLAVGLSTLLAVLSVHTAWAQSPSAGENYVQTQVFRGSNGTLPVTSIDYVDGLGRPVQSVQQGAAPAGTSAIRPSSGFRDIVTTVTYDAFGRTDKTYLPAPGSGSQGQIETSHPTNATSFYTDANPYSVPVYEASPLNRVLSQYGPGQAWHSNSKAVGMDYLINQAGEVRLWTASVPNGINSASATSSTTHPAGAFYPAGELFKTQTRDENGNLVVEFKDKQGQVVQKNVQDGGTEASPTWMVTSYVYNDLDQLAFVIPPKLNDLLAATGTVSVSEAAHGELLFAYHYDSRGRVIEKLVPGGGWTQMVYNKIDQPVMSRTARQQLEGKWSFSKYDAFGRMVLSGQVSSGSDRATLQGQADGVTTQFETRTGSVFGYTNNAFPSVSAADVNLASYYDDYGWGVPAPMAFVPFNGLTQQPARGLATGSVTRVLASKSNPGSELAGTLLYSVTYYDDKNRPVQTFSQNPFGGQTRTDLTLSFAGEITLRKAVYTYADGKTGYTTVTEYGYDHMGRKTRTNHGVGQGTSAPLMVPVAEYVYDEIGRLMQKRIQPGTYSTLEGTPSTTQRIRSEETISGTVTDQFGKIVLQKKTTNGVVIAGGGTVYTAIPEAPVFGTTTALQTVDYDYNIRGWLTAVNKGATLNTAENDLFGMKLEYQEDGITYNGNISKQSWLSHNVRTAPARNYAYSYDKANRLLSGMYSGGKTGENYSLYNMGYDKNGNITSLSRKGMSGGTLTAPTYAATTAGGSTAEGNLVDKLSYVYATGSNKLSTVTDAVSSVIPEAVGDFRDGNTAGADYTYDADGSVTSDRNKGITSVVYNYLGLVETVTGTRSLNGVSTPFTVNYIYDGSGRKWRKIAYNGASLTTTRTDYDGEIVFESAGGTAASALSFISHQEGRVIKDSQSGALLYEYHYTDHLGNLRVAFRQRQTQPATSARLSMEPELAVKEEASFQKVGATRTAGPAHSGRYAARLLAQGGPGKTVKLQAGELLTASVFAYVEAPARRGRNWVPLPVIGDEPQTVDGRTRRRLVIRGGMAVPVRLGRKQAELPEAYLEVIARDSSGKIVSLQTQKLTGEALNSWQELKIQYKATEEQTVQVSVVNASARVSALFDDLTLTQEPPLIVQENHYDPWGWNLAGIEVQGTPNHKFQYNGKERQEEFGLNWSDYGARMYDAQLGRWFVVDPLTETQESWSTYHYVYDNPVNNTDPDGREPEGGGPSPMPYVFSGFGNAIQAAADWVDNFFSFGNKTKAETVVADKKNGPISSQTIVSEEMTVESRTNFGTNLRYIKDHGDNTGNPNELIKTKITHDIKVEQKVEFKNEVGKATVKPYVSSKSGPGVELKVEGKTRRGIDLALSIDMNKSGDRKLKVEPSIGPDAVKGKATATATYNVKTGKTKAEFAVGTEVKGKVNGKDVKLSKSFYFGINN